MGATSTKSRNAPAASKVYKATPERKRFYLRLVKARQALGLDDETYRDKMEAAHQVREGKRLPPAALEAFTEAMEKDAGIESPKKHYPAAFNPSSRKLHAIWFDLGKSGIIKNSSRPALRAFCGRMVKGADGNKLPENVAVDPDLLTPAQARPIIEALKAMQRRGAVVKEGGVE